MNAVLQAAVGYLLLLLVAWLLSARRAAVPWRTVIGGALLQFVLAVTILRVPGAREVFAACNDLLLAVVVYFRNRKQA